MQQEGYPPRAVPWATAKQAGVRYDHGLSEGWPGFHCTNLNLIWGLQQSVPAGGFHWGSIGKIWIALGAFRCRGNESCVSNFNSVVCLKCLVGEKYHGKVDHFIYICTHTKQCIWKFTFLDICHHLKKYKY